MAISASRAELDDILREIENGEWKSVRAAARHYSVPPSSLAHRLAGRQSASEFGHTRHKLVKGEEQAIVDHVILRSRAGFPIPVRLLPTLANIVLARTAAEDPASGPAATVGKHWAERFRNRHSEIEAIKVRVMDQLRLKGASVPRVMEWFDLIKTVLDMPDVLRSNVYNMDETGLQIGVLPSNVKRLVASSEVAPVYKSPNTRESVTAIECIAADGRVLAPALLLKAKQHCGMWYPEEELSSFKDWVFGISPRGYTDNELTFLWLKRSFEPQTRPTDGQPRVLILDGHASHETEEFMTFCWENRIILCRLPAHSSHLTQPLDVGCFSPLKTYYFRELDRTLSGGAKTIPKRTFIDLYYNARICAFSACNVTQAWCGAGLIPFNPDVVTAKIPPVEAQLPPRPSTPPPTTDPIDPALFTTPTTSRQVDKPASRLLDRSSLDESSHQHLVAKLAKCASKLLGENAIINHSNAELTRQNGESRKRRAQKDERLGRARIMGTDDIERARACSIAG